MKFRKWVWGIVVCLVLVFAAPAEKPKEKMPQLLPWSQQIAVRESWLLKRQSMILDMMRRHNVDIWIIVNEEFHNDPLTEYVAPPRVYTGGRDIFVFVDTSAPHSVRYHPRFLESRRHGKAALDEGLRRVAETPEYSYVLAFVPQNLKLDGSFHSLKVTVKAPQKLNIQARRGFYAPTNSASPTEQAKQEIEDAIFSQEELHNLPVKLHTQFFKASEDEVKLIVLTHVDVRLMHFRKNQGRNDNVLTCISALFNRNGNLIQGMEKTVTMHWKDETLEHELGSGITLKTSFDVKPGSYMVRLVVRDAEA